MPVAEIVNTWFHERLGVWPLAGHTEAYNQVAEALPDLIARLDPTAPAPDAAGANDPAPSAPDSEPTPEPAADTAS